jgi:16S rRNA processing protein RimM
MAIAMTRPPAGRAAGSTEARVCVAAVAAAHGVRGLVRLKPFTEIAEDCTAYGPLSSGDGSRVFKVESLGMHKGQVLVRIEGIDERNAAEALRGTRLYVSRDALPEPDDEDEFYHADLIGLSAFLADGTELGTVSAIYDFGAGDSLELKRSGGGTSLLVPFTRETVPEIDFRAGRLVVDPPPGLLDAEPSNPEDTA